MWFPQGQGNRKSQFLLLLPPLALSAVAVETVGVGATEAAVAAALSHAGGRLSAQVVAGGVALRAAFLLRSRLAHRSQANQRDDAQGGNQ